MFHLQIIHLFDVNDELSRRSRLNGNKQKRKENEQEKRKEKKDEDKIRIKNDGKWMIVFGIQSYRVHFEKEHPAGRFYTNKGFKLIINELGFN